MFWSRKIYTCTGGSEINCQQYENFLDICFANLEWSSSIIMKGNAQERHI